MHKSQWHYFSMVILRITIMYFYYISITPQKKAQVHLYIHTSSLQQSLIYSFYIYLFWIFHKKRVIQHIIFYMFDFCHSSYEVYSCSFLLPNTHPLCFLYIWLSLYQFMDIWIIVAILAFINNTLLYNCVQVYVDIYFCRYVGVECWVIW